MAEDEHSLIEEIAALREEVHTLNRHRFIRLQNSMPRMLMFQFMRGLALGLGTVVGASVLVSIVVYILSGIDFIPIVGDYAREIADQIGREVSANPDGSILPGDPARPDPATGTSE